LVFAALALAPALTATTIESADPATLDSRRAAERESAAVLIEVAAEPAWVSAAVRADS
jgi:hypothetical protein